MQEIELKLCPFCGGEAELWRKRGKYGYFMIAQCSTCKSVGASFSDGDGEEENWNSRAAQCAVKAWNRRADDGKT